MPDRRATTHVVAGAVAAALAVPAFVRYRVRPPAPIEEDEEPR